MLSLVAFENSHLSSLLAGSEEGHLFSQAMSVESQSAFQNLLLFCFFI